MLSSMRTWLTRLLAGLPAGLSSRGIQLHPRWQSAERKELLMRKSVCMPLILLTCILAVGGMRAGTVHAATTPGIGSAASKDAEALLHDYDSGSGLFKSSTTTQNWWWSANAFYALTDYAMQTGHDRSRVEQDLAHTYHVVNSFENIWYDDSGWWGMAWYNAYKLTGNHSYLRLADKLWSYITHNGYRSACGGAIIQRSGEGEQNTVTNVVYLRLSVATGHRQQADHAAHWIVSNLLYGNGPLLVGGLTMSCARHGFQMWMNNEGMGIAALASLHKSKYTRIAQGVARVVMSNTVNNESSMIPTVDSNGVLTEPCSSPNWPHCDRGLSEPYVISKGFFMRGAYCAQVGQAFIRHNAQWIGRENDGFLWDQRSPANFASRASALEGMNAALGGSRKMC
jgi:hypothetical protein